MLSDHVIKKIWDKFPPQGRNIPFTEFRKQVRELTDNTRLQTDLDEILIRKSLDKRRQKNGN